MIQEVNGRNHRILVTYLDSSTLYLRPDFTPAAFSADTQSSQTSVMWRETISLRCHDTLTRISHTHSVFTLDGGSGGVAAGF